MKRFSYKKIGRSALSLVLALLLALSVCGAAFASEEAAEDLSALAEAHALPLEGVANAWQLGGYVTEDGRTVRENAILRSGALTNATEEDIRKLSEDYHLAVIMDFRSESEVTQAPDPEVPGAEYINICMDDMVTQTDFMTNLPQMLALEMEFSDEPGRATVESIRQGLRSTNEDLYIEKITSEVIDPGIREFIDTLLAQEEGASVLYHCKNGKDRTGTATMIILTLLGVDKETILRDFDLTNYFLAETIDAEVRQAAQYTDDEEILDVVRVMAGVSKNFMAKAFDYAEEQSGSMLEYIRQRYNVTDEEVEHLRALYLTD